MNDSIEEQARRFWGSRRGSSWALAAALYNIGKFVSTWEPRVKKGRGQRRNRRNK